jgi:hypothetical protein
VKLQRKINSTKGKKSNQKNKDQIKKKWELGLNDEIEDK